MGTWTKIGKLVAASLIAVGALLAASFYQPFEGLLAWTQRYERWQVDEIIVVSVLLAVVFGFYYSWRKREQLRREVAQRERVDEALRTSAARYRAVVASLPASLFAVDPEGVFTLSEGKGLEALGLGPDRVVGRSIFETYQDLPEIMANVRRALAGQTLNALLEVDGSTFETRYSPVRENGELSGVLGVAVDVTERRRAEEELRESERRFATLLSNAPAYLYRCLNEPGWPNEFVSDYAFELTGYTPEELTGGSVMFNDLIVEEDRQRVWEEVQAALAERGRFVLRYAIRRRDGEIRHVEEHGQGVYGEDGEVEMLEGVVYDVTERERTEERLREAEERYRTLVEQIPVIIYVDSLEGVGYAGYTSPQAEAMLGYSLDEWTADRELWVKLVHPDDRERVVAEHIRANANGEPLEIEYRMISRDGRVVWLRDDSVILRDGAGRPQRRQGVIFDVTGREKAEEALREAEERYRTLVEQIPAVTYIDLADGSDTPLYTSPQIEEMLGYTPEEWMAKRLWETRLHPDDRERVLAADERFEAGEELYSEEYRLLARDDRVVWVREEAVVVRNEAGEPLYWQGVIFDITGRKEAEEALRRSESTLSEAQSIAHVGSWEWDPRTGQVSWSDEVFRIYGLAPQQFDPSFERLLEVVHPEDRKLLSENLNAALHRGEPYDFEHRIVTPDGDVRVVHRQAEVVRDERGEPLRMVGTVHDITERKALEERLEHQALHDSLTGLPNRALFVDRLRHALTRAKRRGGEVAVLFMDLDDFKVINDSLGHRTGDRVLVAASKRIRALLRPEDTVARLGGDEFVVLLEDVEDADGAIRVAERISEELRPPFFFGGRQLFVSASVGIVTGGVNGKHAADLLLDADLAMYRAKHAGKARHAVFEETMNTRALERLEMEHGLRRALERKEFVVHYQPIVRLGTGKIPGFEALLRWEHPERGLLTPEEFVPLAEETGLIVPIGKLVLEEACFQAKEWQERHPFDTSVAVCVNLSAKQFREPDLTETVARILEKTGLEPSSLFLEVTESAAMSDAPTTVAALEELQDLGVRVLIDDFGTGYSSLSYLERFPLDYVKIDRSFVGKLDEDLDAAVLVSGMIDLAHALHSEVIAEGVETEEQVERLRGVGCDLAQGFHFSEPLPSEAAGALLETASSGRQ